jgi:hypothetical protein
MVVTNMWQSYTRYPLWDPVIRDIPVSQTFSTWNATWVGDSEWDTRYWHVWGAAVVKDASGQSEHLYI